MQEQNKKNFITNTTPYTGAVKRLFAWLFVQPNPVVYARPFKRDIYLNSTEAIGIWLDVIDQPTTLKQGDTRAMRGGTSREESE